MNEQQNILETEYSSNKERLAIIANEIASLVKEAEILKKKNEHLTYCLGLIGGVKVVPEVAGRDKKPLRSIVLDSILENESVTIDEVWDRVKKLGIQTTKATINSTLFALAKKYKQLDKPEIGLYRKPAKVEIPLGVPS